MFWFMQSLSIRARTTPRAIAVLFVLGGCANDPGDGGAGARAAGDLPRGARAKTLPGAGAQLPIAPFAPPLPFRPRDLQGGGTELVAPPDLAQETWRIFVERDEPLQRPTPRWQALPANRAVEVAMPAPSAFECHVTPAEVTPVTNDYGTELRGWTILRSLLCSRDGFASWTQHPHRLRIDRNGERRVEIATHAYLRERVDEATHAIRIILRSDARRRSARTGPPQIVARTVPDDD